MGKGNRLKTRKRPLQKIRTRSDQEIAEVVVAYKRIYATNPFLANLMLMCSELSEYIEIPPLTDEVGLKTFIKKNEKRLTAQFVQRFKSIDYNVLADNDKKPLPTLLEICELINKKKGLI
jgi:hypothetical protein